MASVVRLALHWRRNEAYGLSDALGTGAIGGVCGLALGAALCVIRDAAFHPAGGWFGAWMGQFLPLAGLGLIEGAAFGIASAFVVARLGAWRRK